MYMLDMLADKKKRGHEWQWYEVKLPFEGYQKNRPAPRVGHASAKWKSKLYIFGGFGEVPDGNDLPQMGYFQDAWVFDVDDLKGALMLVGRDAMERETVARQLTHHNVC